jgi:septum formation protein
MSSATPLILASASPRRRELLAHLGLAFTVLPADVDETVASHPKEPAAVARALSETKARYIAERHPQGATLAADTIVVLDGEILGKPAGPIEATETLKRLRNRAHQVVTAVSLAYAKQVWTDHAISDVIMRNYSDEEITAYIASGDPFDKAGSYAIQHRQFSPVDHCEGCYCNVVGLPLVLTQRLLQEASLSVLNLNPPDLPPACQRCPFVEPTSSSDPLVPRQRSG